jgi:dephospho-CoA kinase
VDGRHQPGLSSRKPKAANRPSIRKIQSARQQRLSLADDIIDNSGDLNELKEKVKKLHAQYLALR